MEIFKTQPNHVPTKSSKHQRNLTLKEGNSDCETLETGNNEEKTGKSRQGNCAKVPSVQVLSQAIHQLDKQDEAAESYQDASPQYGQKP